MPHVNFVALEERTRNHFLYSTTTSDELPVTIARLTRVLAKKQSAWQVVNVHLIPKGSPFDSQCDLRKLRILAQDDEESIADFNRPEEDSFVVVCRDSPSRELESIQEETDHGPYELLQYQRFMNENKSRGSPSPSLSAAPAEMLKRQAKPHLIFNGRPESNRRPLMIHHPAYASFLNRYASNQPPPHLLHASHTLIAKTAAYYSDETARENAIKPAMKILLPGLEWQQDFDGCRPDGSMFSTCGLFGKVPPLEQHPIVCVFDHKPGFAVGSADPIDQAILAYGRAAGRASLNTLKDRSCLPAFGITMAAPILTVFGLAYTTTPICQPLVTLSLLTPPSTEGTTHRPPRERLVRQVASLFGALQSCIGDICTEYQSMTPSSHAPNTVILRPHEIKVSPLPHAPHIQQVTIRGTPHMLQYEVRLCAERMSTAVYVATAYPVLSSGVERAGSLKCVVKFTDSYSENVHSFMHRREAAPELLHCAYDLSVHMFVVVTPYIEHDGNPLSLKGKSVLRTAVEELHQHGLVHGDLREPNILVEKGMPFVIDFDWSGPAHEVSYPFDINSTLKWAEGVVGGAEIKPAHDLVLLNRLLGVEGMTVEAMEIGSITPKLLPNTSMGAKVRQFAGHTY